MKHTLVFKVKWFSTKLLFIVLCINISANYSLAQKFNRYYTYESNKVDRIKVTDSASNITQLKEIGVQLEIPSGWERSTLDLTDNYFHEDYPEIYFTNERGDEVWIWNDYNTNYDIDDERRALGETIAKYAPIHKHIKDIKIQSKGPDVIIHVWRAHHLKNGKKETFTIYGGYRNRPFLDPYYGTPMFFGHSVVLDDEGKTESDIIEMAKYIQTYKKPGNKKAPPIIKGPDLDPIIQRIQNKPELNLGNKSEDHTLNNLAWEFPSDRWAGYDYLINEDTVSWMVPSIFSNISINSHFDLKTRKSYYDTIVLSGFCENYEAELITPYHLVMFHEKEMALINTQNKMLLWCRNLVKDDTAKWNINTDLFGGKKPKIDAEFPILISANKEMIIISRLFFLEVFYNLEAISTTTGKLIWRNVVKGLSPESWLSDENGEYIVSINKKTEETIINGFDCRTGEMIWEKIYENYSRMTVQPWPQMINSTILIFWDDIEAIDPGTGKTVWKKSDLSLDEKCPSLQVIGDTLLIMDKRNVLNYISLKTGQTIHTVKMDNSFEYTNINPADDRIYLRGMEEKKGEPGNYFLQAIEIKTGKSLWIYSDTIPAVSNLIEDVDFIYTSTWRGPIKLNYSTGNLLYRTEVNEVSKTYPVTIQKYNDTLVYIGEMVIAGIECSTGKVLFRNGYDPVSQELNLEAIDPLRDEILAYLKRYGKFELKGSSDPISFENVDRLQDHSANLAKLSREKYADYISSGSSVDLSLSNTYHLQSQMYSTFARNTFTTTLLLHASLGLLHARADLNARVRERLRNLLDKREKLMKLYHNQLNGDYVMRQMEVKEGNEIVKKTAIIHLPSGEILSWIGDDRSKADVILNPAMNEFYYHNWRLVPELEKITYNKSNGTAAHAPYLVAVPLK